MNSTENEIRRHCEFVQNELRSVMDGENPEYEDIYAYLADVLDVEYRLDSALDLIGVSIYVTLGGPNVWIDTRARTIEGAWGTSRAWVGLDCDVCDEIDRYYEDYISDFIRK